MNNKTLLIGLIILIGAFSRIIPHPPNFTAIGAMSILGGLYFGKKNLAFIIPILAMLISDFILGYKMAISVYIAFFLIIPLGMALRNKLSHYSIFKTSIYASIVFFLVTNFFVWTNSSPIDGIYYCPPNFMGFIKCYMQAIPFFFNTLLGDLFFCFSLFGLYEVITKKKFLYINS
tara:strand:- start:7 stop:531 length:525 start_codon:yes stop_codon:yes gene_type:complete